MIFLSFKSRKILPKTSLLSIFPQTPKKITPSTPDKRMSKMGDGGAFFHFFHPYQAAQIKAKTTIDLHSTMGKDAAPRLAKTPKAVVAAVAKIMPTIAGRMPPSTAFTPAYLSRWESKVATSKMMIKDGKTTPKVASIAPRNPPCEEPTKVAMLTAIGPGGRLSNGNKVEEFSFGQPAVCEAIVAHQGNHGISPAKGNYANFEKGEKKRKINHFSTSPPRCFFCWLWRLKPHVARPRQPLMRI